ncbi:hypothetical protein GSS88_00160 [Corynebacterium sp. 3HC-13]|uniref:hypothetical protein n=1 Tax=Corynebacterium poyangense TaxID=2684405 RepID=UPI001CCCB617|nr:hypothetical protein [Corynebacterium poyangense]MBZ8176223.1 hypothetical protein [Corynebacterium poyangense]
MNPWSEWFDELADHNDDQLVSDAAHMENEQLEDNSVIEDFDVFDDDDAEVINTDTDPGRVSRRGIIAGVLTGLGVIIVASAAYLVFMKPGSEPRETTVAAETTSTTTSAPVLTDTSSASSSLTSTSALPQRCQGQKPDNDKDLEGVVVAFNKAYFSGDISQLNRLSADGSYLKDVDWPTVLEDQIGASWCVKTKVVNGLTVSASVTAKLTNGEEKIYPQVYHLEKHDGRFQIREIDQPGDTGTT